MIIDSSALVRVLLQDTEEAALRRAMASAPDNLHIGAPTLVETSMVMLGRAGKSGRLLLAEFGDCLSYATAWVAGEPLLCIGDHFPQADLPRVDLSSPGV